MKRTYWLPILLAALLAVTLPYGLALLAAGPEHIFAGFLLNPIDGATYLAKMYQGWAGSWRFTLPFTAEPGEGAYLFLYYLLLGHLARWTGLPLSGIYHAARVAGAVLLVLALARFFSRMFAARPDLARLALWLAAFGSGMGWLIVFAGPLPTDFWVAEAYPFLAMLSNPHFPLGLAALVEVFSLLQDGGLLRAARLAGLGLLMAVVLPFGLVIALLAAGVWAAWTWVEERRLDWPAVSALALPGGPFVLYQYWAAVTDPVLAGWNAQNLTPSPELYDFLLSFSPALPLAVLGTAFMLRTGRSTGAITAGSRRVLVTWLALGLLLVYFPLALQRRFLLGLYIPLAGLAVYAIDALRTRWSERTRWLTPAVLSLSVITNLLLLIIALIGAVSHSPALYLTRGEAQALNWLRYETGERALVLAAPDMGRFIPALTGRRVIYGHPFETVDAAVEEARVNAYFTGETCIEDGRVFHGRRVDYLFYGPRERLLGLPDGLDKLRLVYDAEGVQIYAVEGRP